MNRLTPWFEATSPRHEMPLVSPAPRFGATRYLRLDGFGASRPAGLDETPGGRPLAVFVPEPYEPRYAYPLVVWLHGGGGSEQDLARVMPAISERNFVGAALRGPIAANRGFHWELARLDEWLADLHGTLIELRRAYHVHSERIFLAGEHEGAAMALHGLLRRPEWFAGAVALCPSDHEVPRPLEQFHGLRGKRVLLGAGTRSGVLPAIRNAATGRLLRSAGLDVDIRTYDAGPTFCDEMFRDANAWLVDAAVATV